MTFNEKRNALLVVALFAAIALGVPVMADKEDDGLFHRIVLWVITEKEPEPAQDDVYHPGRKLPQDKSKTVTLRRVCAKEFKTESEAEKFVAKAPADVRGHMHIVNEDE